MTATALRIFCVLKTGKASGQQRPGREPEYFPKHVLRLRDQFAKHYHSTTPYEFACLSDVDVAGVRTIKLLHGWAGWWSKMELFRPELQAPGNFYVDLDTTIKGDITALVDYAHQFTALNNLSTPDAGRIGSGMMAWRAGAEAGLYEAFLRNPPAHMRKYVTSHCWGDQGFIRDHVKGKPAHWQTLFPGAVASYVKGTPQEIQKASIVCFHGKPKPWEIPELI